MVRVDTQQQDGTLLKKKELRNLVQNSETPMVLTGPPGWIGQAAIPGHWNKEYLKGGLRFLVVPLIWCLVVGANPNVGCSAYT